DPCCLHVVWEDQHARGAALHEYRRILDGFAASSVHLGAPLTHQSLPMPRDRVGPWLDGWRVKYLELICFHVPPGLLERQLFEHAYAAFREFVTYPFTPLPTHLLVYYHCHASGSS